MNRLILSLEICSEMYIKGCEDNNNVVLLDVIFKQKNGKEKV